MQEIFSQPNPVQAHIDNFRVNEIEVPRLRLSGTRNVTLVYLPEFGGTVHSPHTRFFANYAQDNGLNYVTCGWPGVEGAARRIAGMSIVQSIYQAHALFAEAAAEIMNPKHIILMGASVAATAALRIARKHANDIDHLMLLSPGYHLRNHMIRHFLRKVDCNAWMQESGPSALHHLFLDNGKTKIGCIDRQDLIETERRFELFHNQQPLYDMPAATIFYGSEDKQIPLGDFRRLSRLICNRHGDDAEVIRLDDAEHMFCKPAELDRIAQRIQQVLSYIPSC